MDECKLFSREPLIIFSDINIKTAKFHQNVICSHNTDISYNKIFWEYLSGDCEYLIFEVRFRLKSN